MTSSSIESQSHNRAICLAPNRNSYGGLKKVLVIDDSADILAVMAEYLSLMGFVTVTAQDGMTGAQIAQEQLPDLIICDITMPILDGYATLSLLRKNEATLGIPFIFLTGATDKVTMRKGMELGADDYLTKPFTYQELNAAVNTRLAKQEEQRQRSEKKLNELRGNLTLALPHELRTPLNGIMGWASLLMDDYAGMSPEDVLEAARDIHASALRLHRLIENFLAYSQIELMASDAHRAALLNRSTPLDAAPVVSATASEVARRFGRETDLVLEVGAGQVFAGEGNLRKIVEELVDNAFKFSEPGQRVRVVTEQAGKRFTVEVQDQGRGMTPEQIAQIGPHMQFNRGTYEQQGAGLGLVITKRLTELLGGQFSIQSTACQGTTARAAFVVNGSAAG
jgi:signal transduction histidine kinase